MQSERTGLPRALWAGFVLSVVCLAVVAYYTASDAWGPIVISAYEEPRWIVSYPAQLRYTYLALFLLNFPSVAVVEWVVIPAVDAPAKVDAWLSVALNLMGILAWWWGLARMWRWRVSRRHD